MVADRDQPAHPLKPYERQAVRGVLAERERRRWLAARLLSALFTALGLPALLYGAISAFIKLWTYVTSGGM